MVSHNMIIENLENIYKKIKKINLFKPKLKRRNNNTHFLFIF